MESKIDYAVNDSELVLFVRENVDDEAKDFLYDKYTPLIHKEINRVKKRAIALGVEMADLSQEAMLAFSHAINNFNEQEDTKFMTFATIIIRRKLANYLNKFETKKNKTLGASVSMDAPFDDDGQSTFIETIEEAFSNEPLKKMITYETLKEVNRAIKDKLSEKEKVVLQYDLEGKSVSEIADITGLTTKQIYNLIHRARGKLKI